MDEQQIRQLVQQEIAKNNSQDRFRLSPANRHTHNGQDAPKINQKNITPNDRSSGSVTLAVANQQYSFKVVFSPTFLLFNGIATKSQYTFTVTAANATAGAVYTTSGFSFTVKTTIAGATSLVMYGPNVFGDTNSGTLTKVSGTGDATITFSNDSHTLISRAHCIGTAILGGGNYFQPQSNRSVIAGQQQTIVQSSSYFDVDTSGATPAPHALTDEGHIVDVEYPQGTIFARATIISADNNNIVVYTDNLDAGWEITGNFVIM